MRVLLIATLLLFGCGEPDENNGSTNTGTSNSPNNVNNTTCTPACEAGEVQEFGACDDASCTTRMVCGETITCRNQAQCLATSACADGGLLLDSCPADAQNCLPYMVCGVQKACITLQTCARDACDAGEQATTLPCSDPAITTDCREVMACGADSVSCVCRASDLFCEEEETFDTAPCTPGQQCREVQGCGTTFYCKGDSI